MSDNGNLLKQVHDLKKIIMDNSSNVFQTHNFNQLSNNFGGKKIVYSINIKN